RRSSDLTTSSSSCEPRVDSPERARYALSMALDLGIALLFFVLGAGFVFVNLTLGKYFRPDNPYPDKNEIYECGERPIGGAWMQFNPRFYLVALIFLIFDVEIVFVFPIATVFK